MPIPTTTIPILTILMLLLTSSFIPSLNPIQLQSAYAITFRNTKNLSNNDGDSTDPQVEATGNKVYIVWKDESKGNGDILFRRSTDGGKSFDKTINLSNNNGESSDPKISKSGNNVYVVWRDDSTGDGDIYFRRSTSNGDSFGSTKNLSNDPNESRDPEVAAIGNKVYVAWIDVDLDFDFPDELFFRRSTNEGDSFGGTIKNINGVRDCIHGPQIDAVGNNVYITYNFGCEEDQRVAFARSTNNGASFSSSVIIASIEGVIGGFETKAVGNNVYVVWSDSDDIFLRKSTNNGGSFGSERNISNNLGNSFNPDLDITGRNVYVSWVDDTPGNNDILFRRSTNEADSFGSTKNLSNNDGNSNNPQISSLGTAVRIVWEDETPGNNDIFFRASGNKGDSFGSTRNLSDNEGDSSDSMIISAEDNIYTVWQDNTLGNFDILFKKGTD
jgi:hypothetical protein